MNIAIVIPFRDRGRDPLRAANLQRILAHWAGFGAPVHVADDGRTGDAQFNRSAAYNRGAAATDADILIYTESDMLLPYQQIRDAVTAAESAPGLVVPFTEYHYLSSTDSQDVRDGVREPADCIAEFVRDNGASIGAVNVVSRSTLNAVGQYDEAFEGSWYDDTAMRIAFDVAAGPTRWISGPAHHLFHLPGWTGDHLTAEDKAATVANKARLSRYEQAETTDQIRELTSGVRA